MGWGKNENKILNEVFLYTVIDTVIVIEVINNHCTMV